MKPLANFSFMRFLSPFLWLMLWSAIGLTCVARPSLAHPMGNFSINHYARFEAQNGDLALRYVLDFAEIPTSERMAQLDVNGDETITAAEKSAFLKSEVESSLRGLSVQIDGGKAELQAQSSQLDIRPGAGGLQTLRIVMNCKTPLTSARLHRVTYADSNFPNRNGWMEILATGSMVHKIIDSSAATVDRSRELIVFPTNYDTVAPRLRNATFSIISDASAGTTTQPKKPASPVSAGDPYFTKNEGNAASTTNSQTPQNRFTQSIAERQLTPALVMGGLLAALAFGAVHALSPGHGKTMVAAYLVGSRGTARHAVLLGLVVTITHTLGVFALGLALLVASRYILPEHLFPALSALSGLLIFGVGLWLFMSRWQLLSADSHSHHGHSHGDHSHDSNEHSHQHLHEGHEHSHEHDEASHSHGVHVHSHGGAAHSHSIPEGPITLRTLVALGISGGIVPCPEALVVLLAAVKLHRIGYGMLLITAFSIGLATALVAIGLVVVAARDRLGASTRFGSGGSISRYLPLGSAVAITMIGAVLTLRAAIGTP